MPPRKKKRTSPAPAKPAEPDVVHLAGTMQEAAAAWVKRAKDALEQKSPPTPTAELEAIMIAAEEFTWAGTDMDDVRKVAANVSIAIAFQKELAILKRRISLGEDESVDGRTGWEEPELDDADITALAGLLHLAGEAGPLPCEASSHLQLHHLASLDALCVTMSPTLKTFRPEDLKTLRAQGMKAFRPEGLKALRP